jgi:hypothetical protein
VTDVVVTPPTEPPPSHPVRLVDKDDLRRSRPTVFVRALLALPHLVWVSLYGALAILVAIANWLATLLRGAPPERIHRWLVRYLRYSTFVFSYLYVLGDPYPPFHGTEGSYPIDLEAAGPERQRRLITALRLPLAIPALVLSWVFTQIVQLMAIAGWFVALAIGRMPRGMENLGLYCLRYRAQTIAYLLIMTDRYPSLSGD